MKQYIKDEFSGKVYEEEVLATTTAVDPNHFDTDIQNLEEKVEDMKKQIEEIETNQIPAIKEERDIFFEKFPELKP